MPKVTEGVEGPEGVCVDQLLALWTFDLMTLVHWEGQGWCPYPTNGLRPKRSQLVARDQGQVLLQRPHLGFCLGTTPASNCCSQPGLIPVLLHPRALPQQLLPPRFPSPALPATASIAPEDASESVGDLGTEEPALSPRTAVQARFLSRYWVRRSARNAK